MDSVLSQLQLPQDAKQFLLTLWHIIQSFDDIADDEISRDELHALIWNVLVSLPSNTFFAANAGQLLPIIAMQILKWKASDDAEREGRSDANSYIYRAGYYEVVLAVFQIVYGPSESLANADRILRLYGETLDDYKGEFHA